MARKITTRPPSVVLNGPGREHRARPAPTPPMPSAPVPQVPFSEAPHQVFAHWASGGQHTEQTLARMTETVLHFQRRLAAGGRRHFAEVQTSDVRGFVLSQTIHGTAPEVPTQYARRTAVRTLFRTLRHLSLVVVDHHTRQPQRSRRRA